MKTSMNQKGNVLFLILIAVALFAALSYAVTQSSRSGGDASRETNILNSAQLTQYPTSVRTAVMRLIIDGYQDTQLLFNRPGEFSTDSEAREVFHPVGGGAIYQAAPSEMLNPGESGDWFFNMEFEIPEIGLSSASSMGGNELIAFLPGITDSVCRRLNLEAGIETNPTDPIPESHTNFETDYETNIDDDYTFPADEVILGDDTDPDTNAYSGKPFGCFKNNGGDGDFVFYSVLLER